MPHSRKKHYLSDEQKKIVEDNINFLWYYFKKDVTSRYNDLNTTDHDDIIAALYWGLCMAAESYDPKKGKFTTICQWYFKSVVSNYFREKKLFRGRYQLIPFIYNDLDFNGQEENFSMVKKGGAVDEAEINRIKDKVDWEDLDSLIDKSDLTSAEVKILHMKYKDNMTLKDIGKIYGCSGERIRQLLQISIEKIQVYVKSSELIFSDFM